jgi:hypothetical protein
MMFLFSNRRWNHYRPDKGTRLEEPDWEARGRLAISCSVQGQCLRLIN